MRSEVARDLAEHEAAHAVVARHFGHPVLSVSVGIAGGGATRWDSAWASGAERAAVTAAGDLWNREFGTVEYRDLACSDLARLVRETGVGGVWNARRLARSVLAARRRAVLALADRLEVEQYLTFNSVRLGRHASPGELARTDGISPGDPMRGARMAVIPTLSQATATRTDGISPGDPMSGARMAVIPTLSQATATRRPATTSGRQVKR